MPLWRRFPPVYTPLRAGALIDATRAVRAEGARQAHERATKALEALYPEHRVRLVSSGTSALTLALQQRAPAQDNRTPVVALPAYACPDLGSAAIGAQARIRLYDVHPRTLQPDWESLEAQLLAGVTHVVAAHLFGRLVDVPKLRALAERHGALVIEDAAQHAGGTLGGVRGGALAAISILSFGRGKGLNAGGGGALLTARSGGADAELDAPLRDQDNASRRLAIAAAAELLSRPVLYRLPSAIPALGLGTTEYHPPEGVAGLPGTSAALLLEAMRTEPAELAARRQAEAWYERTVPERCRFALLSESASGALRFPVRLPAERAVVLAAYGVARSYPRTLAEYPQVAAQLLGSTLTPGAAELAATLHTLPTHRLLRERDREALMRALLRVVERGGSAG